MVAAFYKILLHREVIEEDSLRFDKKTKDKIKAKCRELLASHPEQVGEPLAGGLHPYRKLKIFNDYRVVYRVDKIRREVFILAVGIRRSEEVSRDALARLKG